jgi:hypothetical protein
MFEGRAASAADEDRRERDEQALAVAALRAQLERIPGSKGDLEEICGSIATLRRDMLKDSAGHIGMGLLAGW